MGSISVRASKLKKESSVQRDRKLLPLLANSYADLSPGYESHCYNESRTF